MSQIRIVLADDHQVVREGTRRMLDREADMQVVGEAADGQQAVDMVADLRPDVVVLDVRMPHLSGIEATKQVNDHHLWWWLESLHLEGAMVLT